MGLDCGSSHALGEGVGSYLILTAIKLPTRSNLRVKGLVLAHSLRESNPPWRRRHGNWRLCDGRAVQLGHLILYLGRKGECEQEVGPKPGDPLPMEIEDFPCGGW